jgi:multidrug efflux pump subunit AcrA (membrane-fusion protein)
LSKKKSKKWIWIIIILIIIIGGYVLINKSKSETNPEINANIQIPNLEYKVQKRDFGDYTEIVGNVNADTRTIYPPFKEKITDVFVEEGQKVEIGDHLLKFEDLTYRINYISKQIDYDNSLNMAEKIRELKKLQLEQAKEELEKTTLKSPVKGTIEKLDIGVGDNPQLDKGMMVIVDNESMRVKSSIDELDLPNIKLGMKAIIEFNQLGVSIPGELTLINPVAESSGGIVYIPVEIKFTEDPLKYGIISGLTANVKLVTLELKNSIAIPKEALKTRENGTKFVYIKTSEGKKEVDVKSGKETKKYVEILEGLKEGDIVLLIPDGAELQRLQNVNGVPRGF